MAEGGGSMYRIAIVEDDQVIAKEVAHFLTMWGYQVSIIQNFQNVLNQIINSQAQLILLDIALPFFNGFYWCQKIRELSNIPIIFISSASDKMNMVMAMNMGADDFIAKPFDLTVLNAKIQALLRRSYDYQIQNNFVEWQGAIIDLSSARLNKDGCSVDLTKNEFKILQILIENKGKIVSRDSLMVRLWETDMYVDENTLNVNVNRLRRKLEKVGLHEVILTKKGLGYQAL